MRSRIVFDRKGVIHHIGGGRQDRGGGVEFNQTEGNEWNMKALFRENQEKRMNH